MSSRVSTGSCASRRQGSCQRPAARPVSPRRVSCRASSPMRTRGCSRSRAAAGRCVVATRSRRSRRRVRRSAHCVRPLALGCARGVCAVPGGDPRRNETPLGRVGAAARAARRATANDATLVVVRAEIDRLVEHARDVDRVRRECESALSTASTDDRRTPRGRARRRSEARTRSPPRARASDGDRGGAASRAAPCSGGAQREPRPRTRRGDRERTTPARPSNRRSGPLATTAATTPKRAKAKAASASDRTTAKTSSET